MSKILFVNGNLHGHINPTLPVVKELVQRGNEVYYCSTREFEPRIRAVGAAFLDYGEEFDAFIRSFRPHGNHPFYTLMEYMLGFDRTVIPIVTKLVTGMSFDLLVHDAMFGGGNILADLLRLPAIASCSSFVMEKPPLPDRMLERGFHPQLDYLYEQLSEAQTEWKLKALELPDLFFKKAPMTLVYTSRRFHPSGESFGDSFCFVGPSIADRDESYDFPIKTSAKLVYITMGTILNRCNEFYNQCIDAFAGSDYQVIISVGSKTNLTELKEAPGNIHLRTYVPQLEVLKRADVVISHGGLNSVSEALYYGVPVIAIPLANDQPAVAKRLSELGAGTWLKMEEVTPELLLTSVNAILSDNTYREHSVQIGDTFREAGGFKKAADLITGYLEDLNQ